MDPLSYNPDARALEESFFMKQNAALLEKIRREAQQKQQRQALREAIPNADDKFLDQLIAMGMTPATVLAIVLVPLAAVAWADGSIDKREREALIKAAEERGVAPGSAARQLLDTWLSHRPEPALLETWKRYMKSVYGGLEEKERRAVHARLLEMARGVATAAGGFLGLGPKISPQERAVLDDLDKALA